MVLDINKNKTELKSIKYSTTEL